MHLRKRAKFYFKDNFLNTLYQEETFGTRFSFIPSAQVISKFLQNVVRSIFNDFVGRMLQEGEGTNKKKI